MAAIRSMPCAGVSSMNSLALREHVAGVDQLVDVVAAQVALAQLVAVDAGLAAEQALGQFDPRLFQADEEDRQLFLDDRRAASMSQRERRFPDDGRAARIMSSLFWNPAVISSRSTNPVGDAADGIRVLPPDPLVDPGRSSLQRLRSVVVFAVTPFSAMSRIFRSAAPSISSAGCDWS